jgi:hypothetical protein
MPGGGSAQEAESSREHELPTRTKPPGASRKTAGLVGCKPLKRRYQALGVWYESARAEHLRETIDGPQDRRKALKSEAQERWRLKEATKGKRANTIERVAKP